MTTHLFTPAVLANTYEPRAYESGWAAVEAYREWEEWQAEHPDSGYVTAGRALEMPESRIRGWESGQKPPVVQALDTARKMGWLDATPQNTVGRGLARLLAWIYASGSLTAGPRGQLAAQFTVQNQAERSRLERWGTQVGISFRYNPTDGEEEGTVATAAEHSHLLARTFIAMGATVGRATERTELPRAIKSHPDSPATAGFVATYLRNRGTVNEYVDNRFWFREERVEEYLENLAQLFERVVGTDVGRSEKSLHLAADEVQSFLEDVDDVNGPHFRD